MTTTRGRRASSSPPQTGAATAPIAEIDVAASLRPGPRVSIRRVKENFLPKLPEGHPLREVLLQERDILTVEELIAKLETWQLLLNRRA